MEFYKIENFKNGWFIGNFEPSLIKTSNFEVGVKFSKKNQPPDLHYHKIITEYNLIGSGKIKIDDKIYETGDIIVIKPNEVFNCEFLEDTMFFVIKTPSITNDKYNAV
jgi:quercetin dioxygenase-like cupin family protein